jgi:nuclear migration protein JNM1
LESETPGARLRRLKAELDEVEREIRESKAESLEGKGRGESGLRIPSGSGSGSGIQTIPGTASGAVAKRRSVLPPRQPVDLLGDVSDLRARLAGVDVGEDPRSSAWQDRLGSLLGGTVSSAPPLPDQGERGVPSASTLTAPPAIPGPKLSELDQRLALLETTVGTSTTEQVSVGLPPRLRFQHCCLCLTAYGCCNEG